MYLWKGTAADVGNDKRISVYFSSCAYTHHNSDKRLLIETLYQPAPVSQ
jgi:hypothetical protein